MNLRKQTFMKIALGLALVVAAGFLTVVIRDALAQRKPENALPEMTVHYESSGSLELDTKHVRRDKFSWTFLFWPVRTGGGLDLEIWREIEPAWVPPNTPLVLEFTFPPDSYTISMATEEGRFSDVDSTELAAPDIPGTYTYHVSGDWGTNRSVDYYFKIRIPDWQ